MSDDTPFAQAVLGRLDAIGSDISEVRSDVKELRSEVADTYARESDCVSRTAHEREQTSASMKRVWETVEGHGSALKKIDERVDSLEKTATIEASTTRVKGELWKWIVGVMTALIVGAILGWLKGQR